MEFTGFCCHSNASVNRGILRDKNGKFLGIQSAGWNRVINSPIMKSVRKNMLEGKWPKECIRCKREFASNMNSRNIYERQSLAGIVEKENYPGYNKAKALTQSDGTISPDDFPVSFLDVRFGNLCNLKCIMCGPGESNKWYDDYSAIWKERSFSYSGENIELIPDSKGKLKPKRHIFEWSDNIYFWSQVEQHINKVRRIYIAGRRAFACKGSL